MAGVFATVLAHVGTQFFHPFFTQHGIIALGTHVTVNPGEHHAHIHAYLLSLELFMTALTPFADMFIKKKIEKRKEKKLQTTSE